MGNSESHHIKNDPNNNQSNNQNNDQNLDIRKKIKNENLYNMKVIICGAKGSGKTNLWRRLQGIKFNSNHIPTNDVQVTKINWNTTVENDIVPVDIWDITNDTDLNNNNYIYNSTNAVLFTINPFDFKSLEYVINSYMHIPLHINILLLLIAKDLTSNNNNNNNEIISASIENETNINKSSIKNQVVSIEMVEDLYLDIKKYRKKLYKKSSELLVNNNENDFLDVSIHMFEISSKNCFGYQYLYEVIKCIYLYVYI